MAKANNNYFKVAGAKAFRRLKENRIESKQKQIFNSMATNLLFAVKSMHLLFAESYRLNLYIRILFRSLLLHYSKIELRDKMKQKRLV